jgi:EpsI family protein
VSPRARLLGVWVAASLPLVLWAHARWSEPAVREFPASALPGVLAGHRAVRDEPLDARVLEILAPQAYALRTYAHASRPALSVYVASYTGQESGSAHDPSVCYPSQGWDLLHLRSVDVPLPGGEKLSVKLLSAAQAGEQQLALYWFQPHGRWPQREPLEEWLRVLDRLRGRGGHAFVRIALADGGEPDFTARAVPVLIEVAQELAPWLRSALEGSLPPPASGSPAGDGDATATPSLRSRGSPDGGEASRARAAAARSVPPAAVDRRLGAACHGIGAPVISSQTAITSRTDAPRPLPTL